MLDGLDLIESRKIDWQNKPIAIIYNPVSGKSRNIRPMIEHRLSEAKIPFEFLATKTYFDPFMFAYTLDMDKYSALVASGGDGTCHEVVSGMLMREDKRTLPMSFFPNGSGDDFCSSMGIYSVDHALDYIISARTIQIDTVKVLLDTDSEESLPQGAENIRQKASKMRYMNINAAISMPAKINAGAQPYKGCCGKNSYVISTLIEACKGNFIRDIFEIDIDGTVLDIE